MLTERWNTPVAIVQEYRAKIEKRYSGELRIKRGHLLFEFEFDTGDLVVRSLDHKDSKMTAVPRYMLGTGIGIPEETVKRRFRLEKRPGCYYFGALNFKNAFKHLGRILPNVEFTKTSD